MPAKEHAGTAENLQNGTAACGFAKDCHKGTSLDDAQTIAFYEMVEEQYGKEYILANGSYPVWWDLVVK